MHQGKSISVAGSGYRARIQYLQPVKKSGLEKLPVRLLPLDYDPADPGGGQSGGHWKLTSETLKEASSAG
jgi:hypothetical protein